MRTRRWTTPFRFGFVRKAMMGTSPELAAAKYPLSGGERRGIPRPLDRIPQVFLHVLGAMLEEPTLWQARFVRDTVVMPYRGFAVEGIAMGLAMCELTNPFSRSHRSLEFAEDLDGRQRLLAYVGIGMALARFHRRPKLQWAKMCLDTREFVLDGFGFGCGLFKWKKCVDGRRAPRDLTGRDRTMFDEGLGRIIWVVSGADIHSVAKILRTFSQEREHDLWGGVGMASTYAGVCDRAGYEVVQRLAGVHFPALARGCAAACFQRAADRYIPDHSEMAARVFWNTSVTEVAERFTRYRNEVLASSSESAPIACVYDRLEQDALVGASWERDDPGSETTRAGRPTDDAKPASAPRRE